LTNKWHRGVIAACIALIVVGCDRSIGARILGSQPVEIGDVTPEDLKKDAFTLSDTHTEGPALHLIVVSGGGCREHSYSLTMTPAAFMESYPVQANVYLRHDDHDDPCDAIVTDTVVFDMTPVINLYRQMYGPSGQINLNLFNFEQTESTRQILHVR
jgi:hypothetical protein